MSVYTQPVFTTYDVQGDQNVISHIYSVFLVCYFIMMEVVL